MARVFPGDFLLRAKMDTGAKSSSINAENMTVFEKEGKQWARFELKDKKKSGKVLSATLEKEVIRFVSIKKKEGGISRRPVVFLEVCLGGIYKQIAVNLVDRSNFNYQLLIGRSDLERDFVIDPSLKFTRKPECKIQVELDPAR